MRNQFVENQMTHDKLRDPLDNLYTKSLFDAQRAQPWMLFEELPVQPWAHEDVERCIGGFTGSALANDFGLYMTHACCTGNAARTLYWIWDSILTKEDDRVRVNLLLNHASPWLDVDSYLPYEGKVVLKIKEAQGITVRVPEWTEHKGVTCKVNGKEHESAWSRSYVELKDLKPGDAVTVEFPMREKTMFSVIGDKPYKLALKGNTVVDIDPEGEICPLYQRDLYKQDQAPVKKVTRFVSRETILW